MRSLASMDQELKAELEAGGIADITTIGRKSGKPRRIEIYFHHFDGEFILTGRPGFKRDWMANLLANPDFTLHLKQRAAHDIPVVAEPITDPEERAEVLFRVLTESWGTDPDKARRDLSIWVEKSPLVRFQLADRSSGTGSE